MTIFDENAFGPEVFADLGLDTPDYDKSDKLILADILTQTQIHSDDGGRIRMYNFRVVDVAARTNLASATVFNHVRALVKRNVLVRAIPDEKRRKGQGRTYWVEV